MFCRLFWRRRGIKNGTQPFWPCPVAVSAVLPASRSAVRRISNRLCRGCGCGCVCRVLCRFPGASPRLSRPVSCSLRYGERSPQVSAGFRPCRRSSTGARSSSKRPCERCFLAAVIFLAAALPRVVVPCLRTVGCLPRIAAFAFRGRARTALPCCARSCYRADDKPIAGFCIANTYYFDDFINKKNCKSAKML